MAGGMIAASAVVGVGVFKAVRPEERVVAVLRLKPGLMRGKGGAGEARATRADALVKVELELPAGVSGGKYLAVLSTPEDPAGLWSGAVETGAGTLASRSPRSDGWRRAPQELIAADAYRGVAKLVGWVRVVTLASGLLLSVLGLSAAMNQPIGATKFGVFRM